VPDYRNSLAINIYKKLKKIYKEIRIYDPVIEKSFYDKEKIKSNLKDLKNSDIFIILVKHKQLDCVINFAKKNKKILIDPLSLI